jgi:hypothetical protein
MVLRNVTIPKRRNSLEKEDVDFRLVADFRVVGMPCTKFVHNIYDRKFGVEEKVADKMQDKTALDDEIRLKVPRPRPQKL